MSGLTENEYRVKDLYIVKLSEDYQKYLKIANNNFDNNYLDSINYFIVEKCFSKEILNNHEIYYEFYTECVLGKDFYERTSNVELKKQPEIFQEIYPFSVELLKENEKELDIITTGIIFRIFMEINNFQNQKSQEEKHFVKRIGAYGNNN